VAGLPCPDDYEKTAVVTSDILSLSSLKKNAQYNLRTGRDYCYVGPKGTEKYKKRKKKNVGELCNM
jgi:hypothetical protein